MKAEGFFDDETQLAPPRTIRIDFDDGSFALRSPVALRPYARCVGEWLERWARETPDALALAERDESGEGWRKLDYRALRRAVGAVAQGLLDLGVPRDRPVVILSDNAIDHAVLMLATMHIGRTACSLSSAYSRMAKDPSRLHGMLQALDPALIYASDAKVYGGVLAGCGVDAITVFSRNADAHPGARSFDRLLATHETPAVMQAFEAILPDTHAKYLLTSGSTGRPKVVINTHRMLCANQQMIAQTWRFLDQETPVLVDWLPWSHTFGANHNFNIVLCHGGALYIDEGRPAPGLIEKTVRNLREVRPTLLFNVPRGYDMLLPALEADEALAADVLSRLRLCFYAAAALAPSTWQRLEAVAKRARPAAPLWLTTSWGATETSPAITSAHWKLDGAGCIGAPLPGLELKFVPNGDKLEMRVKGVSVFPGYRNAPRESAQAFDEEGYYRIGDAGYLVDAQRPECGVMFNGRVAEDFKLTSGTWVSVGTLRVELVSRLAPLVQDVVITGHDRDAVGMLVFPSAQAAQRPREELAAALLRTMRAMHDEGAGSSRCPVRALVLTSPPDIDAGEITDKGYINQRAVLLRRAAEVERLHADAPDREVVRAD
ncbi:MULTISPECIES: feruloyl-CoA synthase [unclassified Variovorax]|uniref:feruloyl-CoA synthase n=2 Tax=Variovorax TaxID=34072 RepID=UPI000C9AD1B3|nr:MULTISPECIES: feruloyl-CoA synthase [unclassified Variovorax]PNG58784.1 Carboxylic acid reductase [Variovorax sp. B4]PNG61426.1 Carboxylic acid reductase [Variovorax sp. B2]VTV12566.1 Long-chain-fatty-acid--CoA ligase [Variovorax sp. WDL1]